MKKLSRKEAKDLSLKLWRELAKTGDKKESSKVFNEVEKMENHCPLCEIYNIEYGKHDKKCKNCPLAVKSNYRGCRFNNSFEDKDDDLFSKWANSERIQDKKMYAKKIADLIERWRV